jgi:hypothetical protein
MGRHSGVTADTVEAGLNFVNDEPYAVIRADMSAKHVVDRLTELYGFDQLEAIDILLDKFLDMQRKRRQAPQNAQVVDDALEQNKRRK